MSHRGRAFEGNFGEVLLKSSTQPVPPLRERCPEASQELCLVIEKALAREVEMRRERASLQTSSPPRGARFLQLGAARCGASKATTAPARPGPPPLAGRRRRFARAPYVTIVSIERRDGSVIDARSEDISLGGMLVLPKAPARKRSVSR